MGGKNKETPTFSSGEKIADKQKREKKRKITTTVAMYTLDTLALVFINYF